MATFAMLVVGLLESAIGALNRPIFDQAFAQGAGIAPPRSSVWSELFPIQAWLHGKPFDSPAYVYFRQGDRRILSTYLMARIGQSAVLNCDGPLPPRLSKSASSLERHRTNYIVSRLVSSAAALSRGHEHYSRHAAREFYTQCFFGRVFLYSWRLTLGSLLLAPLVAILTARFGHRLRNLARDSFEGSKNLRHCPGSPLESDDRKSYRGEEREANALQRSLKTDRRRQSADGTHLGICSSQ